MSIFEHFSVDGKSSRNVRKRIRYLRKRYFGPFLEFLTVRKAAVLLLSHKEKGSPNDRTISFGCELIRGLNLVLDSSKFNKVHLEFTKTSKTFHDSMYFEEFQTSNVEIKLDQLSSSDYLTDEAIQCYCIQVRFDR